VNVIVAEAIEQPTKHYLRDLVVRMLFKALPSNPDMSSVNQTL
jgi:hypothetical protein